MLLIPMTDEQSVLRERTENNWPAVEKLSRADLEMERTLHQTKWYDYRFISPMEATYQFRALYSEIFQRKFSRNFDTEEAHLRTGVRSGAPFSYRRELTSFWRARQHADYFGLPYAVFIEVAFDVLLDGGWTRLPHINQLYSMRNLDRIYKAAAALWVEHQEVSFSRSISRRPEYRNESYHQFPSQTAHRAWVKDLLKEKHSNAAIGDACFVSRVLPAEMAAAEFGKDRLVKAEYAVAAELVEPTVPKRIGQILPSCLGLPGAFASSSAECTACPAAAICARSQKAMSNALKDRLGSDNPEFDRRKEQQRNRTRRFRAKQNLTAAGSLGVHEERPPLSVTR